MHKKSPVALILVLALVGCGPKPETSPIPKKAAVQEDSPTEAPTQESTPGPIALPVIEVDSCGANPFDDQPDSGGIQECINLAQSGEIVQFTSPGGDPDYQGYIINQTIYLVSPVEKNNLTFTSSDPEDHALLIASPDLLGFVVQLYSLNQGISFKDVDDITLEHIDLDGNRADRSCYGEDEIKNGIDDNWGSLYGECIHRGDAWCTAGTLAMRGYLDPDNSTSGLVVQDVRISNTECGTALEYSGTDGLIDSVVIDTSGEHTHGYGCELTDPDESVGAWADGITFSGWNNTVTNNTVINASDIGIVCFSCLDTTIAGNTVIAESGNHGMFAGIAVHPYWRGDISGTVVENNRVVNEADQKCGGIHAGINIGVHMWGAGCSENHEEDTIGTVGPCSSLSGPPGGTNCDPGQPCRIWGYIPPGKTLTLANNTVVGAQVNYLIEGVEIAGELIIDGNISEDPQMTDWQGSRSCNRDGFSYSWGAMDFVAHDPILEGWIDQPIFCAR